MRRAGLALFAAAALLGAAVPAWSGDDGKVAPQAELSISPQALVAGEPAVLDASGSRDPDGAVTSFAWDLDGDGAFERQSGSESTLAHAFEKAGDYSVGVRVVDDSGDSADARKRVSVAAPPEPESAAEPEAAPETKAAAERKAASEPKAASPQPKAAGEADGGDAGGAEGGAAEDRSRTRIRAAASQTVSVKDFSFGPKSVTVNVGDTVTWRNTGDEVHTASARDGSFDTGNLDSGESGSVSFEKAGTFGYFCKPHAFMTGIVTVTGSGSGGGSGGGGGDTQGVTGTGDDDSGSGDDLPSTGLALLPFLLAGVGMIAGGATLRRQCAKTQADA